MPASWPASIKNFGPAHQDFTENILAAHVNDVQDEVVALQTNTGVNPHVGQDLNGANTTYATLKARIDAIISGVRTHTHAGTDGVKLAQANTHQSPDTDVATTSLHHTLGTGANNAAAGNHGHTSSQVTGLDSHTAATEAHGATGAVVGTTNVQTLTNKVITALASGTGVVPLTAQGMTAQTADLQQWKNSVGTVLGRVNTSGRILGVRDVTDGGYSLTMYINNVAIPANNTQYGGYVRRDDWLTGAGYSVQGDGSAIGGNLSVNLPGNLPPLHDAVDYAGRAHGDLLGNFIYGSSADNGLSVLMTGVILYNTSTGLGDLYRYDGGRYAVTTQYLLGVRAHFHYPVNPA